MKRFFSCLHAFCWEECKLYQTTWTLYWSNLQISAVQSYQKLKSNAWKKEVELGSSAWKTPSVLTGGFPTNVWWVYQRSSGMVSIRSSFSLGATIIICCSILHIAPLFRIFIEIPHILCWYRPFHKIYWGRGIKNLVAFRFSILYCAFSASIILRNAPYQNTICEIPQNKFRTNVQYEEYRNKKICAWNPKLRSPTAEDYLQRLYVALSLGLKPSIFPMGRRLRRRKRMAQLNRAEIKKIDMWAEFEHLMNTIADLQV